MKRVFSEIKKSSVERYLESQKDIKVIEEESVDLTLVAIRKKGADWIVGTYDPLIRKWETMTTFRSFEGAIHEVDDIARKRWLKKI